MLDKYHVYCQLHLVNYLRQPVADFCTSLEMIATGSGHHAKSKLWVKSFTQSWMFRVKYSFANYVPQDELKYVLLPKWISVANSCAGPSWRDRIATEFKLYGALFELPWERTKGEIGCGRTSKHRNYSFPIILILHNYILILRF
jgi:hypothetical protein